MDADEFEVNFGDAGFVFGKDGPGLAAFDLGEGVAGVGEVFGECVQDWILVGKRVMRKIVGLKTPIGKGYEKPITFL